MNVLLAQNRAWESLEQSIPIGNCNSNHEGFARIHDGADHARRLSHDGHGGRLPMIVVTLCRGSCEGGGGGVAPPTNLDHKQGCVHPLVALASGPGKSWAGQWLGIHHGNHPSRVWGRNPIGKFKLNSGVVNSVSKE